MREVLLFLSVATWYPPVPGRTLLLRTLPESLRLQAGQL